MFSKIYCCFVLFVCVVVFDVLLRCLYLDCILTDFFYYNFYICIVYGHDSEIN